MVVGLNPVFANALINDWVNLILFRSFHHVFFMLIVCPGGWEVRRSYPSIAGHFQQRRPGRCC